MAFLDLTAELVGSVPGLSYPLARTYINRAWREIRDARLWSFLRTDGAIFCPVAVTSGRAAITRFATTITMDATATAAITAGIPAQFLTQCQIRFTNSGGVQAGQIYNILATDGATPAATFTLDREVMDLTSAAAQYSCYRCYVTAPATNFLRWVSIDDTANGIVMNTKRGLDRSSRDFDQWDPQRQAFGLAYNCGFYQVDTANLMRYELWPHPTSGQIFYARYQHRGANFATLTESQPGMIPDDLIIQRALGWHALPFAAANVAMFPKLKGTNFTLGIQTSRASYVEGLKAATRNDDEQALTSIISRGTSSRTTRPPGFTGPIDAAFIQSHPINW